MVQESYCNVSTRLRTLFRGTCLGTVAAGAFYMVSCCDCRDSDIPEDIQPESVQPLGNYAVQITWQDGFNQVRHLEACWCFLLPQQGLAYLSLVSSKLPAHDLCNYIK